MKKPNEFYLKTISPIHIGCDEVYEPTSFTIDEEAQQMVVFDPFTFISQLKQVDKEKFSDICAKGTIASILEIYKFLSNRKVNGRGIDVCHGFMEHYHKTLAIPLTNERTIKQELNRFEIPRSAFRSIDQRPYIPGSAIKGALRTAYLNLMEDEKGLSKKISERNAKKLEQRLMEYDGISTDPFRFVKVSDFMPVGDIRTRIVYGINKKKNKSDYEARGLPLLLEVIQPGSFFVGTVTVDLPLPDAGIRESVSIENLFKSSMFFYSDEKKREETELKRIEVKGIHDETIKDMQNTLLVRIGRHSGAESLTIKGHRAIYIMGRKSERGKNSDRTTTLWLASERRTTSGNNLQPFGWSQLGSLTKELYNIFKENEQKWQEKIDRYDMEKQAEADMQSELIRKAAEEAKTKAIEEEIRRKEEEREKAEFEAMSHEDRALVTLADHSVSEQQVYEILSRIDEFSEENKQKSAMYIKSFWKKIGKWNKKNCSKKQLIKIQKIKEILDE